MVLSGHNASLFRIVTLNRRTFKVNSQGTISMIRGRRILNTRIRVKFETHRTVGTLVRLMRIIRIFNLNRGINLLTGQNPRLLSCTIRVGRLVNISRLKGSARRQTSSVSILYRGLLHAKTLRLGNRILTHRRTNTIRLHRQYTAGQVKISHVRRLPRTRTMFLFRTTRRCLMKRQLRIKARATRLVTGTLQRGLKPINRGLPRLSRRKTRLLRRTTRTGQHRIVPRAMLFSRTGGLPSTFTAAHQHRLMFLIQHRHIKLFKRRVSDTQLFTDTQSNNVSLVSGHHLIAREV